MTQRMQPRVPALALLSVLLPSPLIAQSAAPSGPAAPIQSAAPTAPADWQAAARAVANPGATNIPAAFQRWKMLSSGDNWRFDDYAGFLMQWPGWPEEARFRRNAETMLDMSSWSPAAAVAYFDRFAPLTNDGRAKYALALGQTGQRDRARAMAREAWRGGALTDDNALRLQALHTADFSRADHDARMDALLWQGAVRAAAAQLAWVSPENAALFGARLALRQNRGDADTLAGAVAAQGATDAGFLADRARFLRTKGRSYEARSLLAGRPPLASPPSNVEEWYETLLTNARAAEADRQYDVAYRISSRVDDAFPPQTDVSDKALGIRDDYTSLTWLAGRVALERLGRPREAAEMFARYGRAARSPQTITKGFYWAGRALKASDPATANRYFEAAATHHDHFYGMLALEALGRPLPPVERADLPPSPTQAPVFLAAEAAGRYGSWKDQSTFLRAIANDAKTLDEHRAAMALSLRLNRPDLAVMAGRNARVNGHMALVAGGYPTVSVPPAMRDNWTLIHAISRQESQFDREAVSHAGARGLMQLMPGTARETAGKVNLSYSLGSLTSDPGYNIMLGSTYIDRMLSYFGGSYVLAVAAYNAGPGNVNKWIAANGDPRTGLDVVRWIEDIPIYETRNYVQRVLENAVMYDRLNPDRARFRTASPLSTYLGKRTPG